MKNIPFGDRTIFTVYRADIIYNNIYGCIRTQTGGRPYGKWATSFRTWNFSKRHIILPSVFCTYVYTLFPPNKNHFYNRNNRLPPFECRLPDRMGRENALNDNGAWRKHDGKMFVIMSHIHSSNQFFHLRRRPLMRQSIFFGSRSFRCVFVANYWYTL